MGKADKRAKAQKQAAKSQKRDFIQNVSTRLVKNPQSFLCLATYSDIKKWMRGVHGWTHQYVDNGHHFLHIITEALGQAHNGSLTSKFAQLQAEHRAAKAAKNAPRRENVLIPISSYATGTMKGVQDTSTSTRNDPENQPGKSSAWLEQKKRELPPGFRIDVYYGKTDNTRGYKEFTCVVVQTNQQQDLEYCRTEGLYFPKPGSQYKILYEVPMRDLKQIRGEQKVDKGFVSPQLRELVLQYACEQHASGRQQHAFA